MLIRPSRVDLDEIFDRFNEKYFDGFLRPPILTTNSRLRSSAGRFIPGSRKYFDLQSPIIEIAQYLCELDDAPRWVEDTMGHEMIHYWLWVRHRPYGHTPEFWRKMEEMGVSRYNHAPVRRAYRHLYRCSACSKEFRTFRRLAQNLACVDCCKKHNNGKYDERFRIEWVEFLAPSKNLTCR